MIPKKYSSEGIVLARQNFSEADRILVIFTRKYGKISLIAKGVRKPKSRKRGSLEIFSYIKFSASKGKGLDLIEEVEVIDSFQTIRKDLKKVSVAYFLIEVVGRLTQEGEKNEALFRLILKYLNGLKNATSLKDLRKDYIKDALVLLGFWPRAKKIKNPDVTLQEISEREFSSVMVGKKLVS